MITVRAARRYRWRLAGGRLIADPSGLRFVPNVIESRRADTRWECRADEVTGVSVRGKVWLVIETAGGTQTFRVLRAAAAVAGIAGFLALPPAPSTMTPG